MTGIWAVVVGAGQGRRFGSELPKQYQELKGETVFRRSLRAFVEHPQIDGVIAVIAPGAHQLFAGACGDLHTVRAVTGAETRQGSVAAALASLDGLAPDRVLVHDAARPLIDAATISRVIAGLEAHQAVVPALPVRDTLKRRAGEHIAGTVDRSELVAVQTPQGFAYDMLRRAHDTANVSDATDDAGLVEALGQPVHLVQGDPSNMKVTDPEDLELAGRLLGSPVIPRVGIGYDVHRLVDGDGVVLGGIPIACGYALLGHSDADVALHTLTDALLGALGEGDIGTLFPPSDPTWRGADSAIFLEEACRRIAAAGAAIAHLDLVIICEQPKIGPHRPAMRRRIAEICSLPEAKISVKATTTERLGFTGRGEGIAAQAVATILCPT